MRRVFAIIFPILTVLIFLLLSLTPILAQDDHTAKEEREGKIILDRLQQKQVACDRLSDEDFERLGEYFMGQMMGDSHEAMNNMMTKMMGEKGEREMHVNMGKRFSGCDGKGGDRSMMGYGGWNNMMGGWGGFGFLGLVFWLFWIVILVDLVLLGIWLWKKIKKEK